MIYRISKRDKTLKGTISLTPSKSISNRVLMISAFCTAPFQIFNLATANDTVVFKNILNSDSEIVNAEDAGTAFRFLTAYLAQKPGKWLLTGTARMKQRPVGILVNVLRKLGAEISFTEMENFPPLKIIGKKLKGGTIELDGNVSSQFTSALLMIAPTLEDGLKIKINGELFSKPYVEMTLKLMNQFGIHSEWREDIISIAQQEYQPTTITIENDWSAASYWYEMAALAEDVDLTIEGLKQNSIQGDSAIAEIMNQFGVKTEFTNEGIRLTKNASSKYSSPSPHPSPFTQHPSKTFTHNFQSHPDLVQTMAVICAALGIDAAFSGVQNLRIKETDRLKALQTELKKIGVLSEITNNEYRITNFEQLHPSPLTFHTYNDHRMAMSFAPLALKWGKVEIENPDVVKKSYPEFWEDLKSVGFDIDFKTS